ncbi:MAG TPA: cysteine--tRNA ligase [Actinomycetota bacterium]|nr:cysteine--tRNA ligase [Actinomycetota bacterium]
MIRLFNSLTREIGPLETREPGRVSMYCCGPTVYNYIHIGNARTTLWCDMIRRYLTYRGYDVTYVMNYTDVDDKIIERAQLEGVAPDDVTAKYAAAFEADMGALGARPADILARATAHIEDMVEAVEGLIARGVAYEVDGDVFFSVEGFPGYGKLSGRTLEDMRAGERVEPHPSKKHPLDFALWKSAKPGEISWPSPWGEGRPGWHIECSVMSTKYLGMGFDLHGGGSDLIFPHHENEIAQAEGLADESLFVRGWLHTGMVQMEAEKMSKSLGNVVLAKDAVATFGGDALRYWALASSYRSQSVYSLDALEDAVQSWARWKTFYESSTHALGEEMPARPAGPRRPESDDASVSGGFLRDFIASMDDDLSSSQAFAAIHSLVRAGNKLLEGAQTGDTGAVEELGDLVMQFLEMTAVLGFEFDATTSASGVDAELTNGLIGYLLELRDRAREERAFDRADDIRDRLAGLGVEVEDTASGPRWRLV